MRTRSKGSAELVVVIVPVTGWLVPPSGVKVASQVVVTVMTTLLRVPV